MGSGEPDEPAAVAEASPFRDAEAWLAARGVEREPIRVEQSPQPPPSAPPPPPMSTGEAARLAEQAARDAAEQAAAAAAVPDPAARRLEDDVAAAVAFVRRSTTTTPQSEGRLRDKLGERGYGPATIDRALERARAERLVDDDAMVAALVAERRRKGHAPARIRRDLAARGFAADLLDTALAVADAEDQEAAAFAVARDKAARVTGLDAQAAFRRVVAHVVRRGYPEALARKVARTAVFASRDPERTTGH